MNNSISSLTTIQLRRTADLKEKIDALAEELSSILGSPTSAVSEVPKRHKMSAAGRAKVAAAQKARWAKVKEAKPSVETPKKKRKMSAAGRARIIAAQKVRWAKVKALAKASK